jgi:hypothetical protein
MDVNYGKAVKHYLLSRVTLLHIHRFDPNGVQFADALVSSAVVWFRNGLRSLLARASTRNSEGGLKVLGRPAEVVTASRLVCAVARARNHLRADRSVAFWFEVTG